MFSRFQGKARRLQSRENWFIVSDETEIRILSKIKESGNNLESISVHLSQGLKTGADKIFISDKFSSLEKEVLIKVLKGEEIQRYKIEYENKGVDLHFFNSVWRGVCANK